MKKIVLLIALGLLTINISKAGKNCICKDFKTTASSKEKVVTSLEKSNLEFAQSFIINKVRGVQSASYYYCDDDHGFLLVKLHDKEVLYKDVPLITWFEFKFADSSESYFKEEIKYNFITL